MFRKIKNKYSFLCSLFLSLHTHTHAPQTCIKQLGRTVIFWYRIKKKQEEFIKVREKSKYTKLSRICMVLLANEILLALTSIIEERRVIGL